jgi:hypothetical protein
MPSNSNNSFAPPAAENIARLSSGGVKESAPPPTISTGAFTVGRATIGRRCSAPTPNSGSDRFFSNGVSRVGNGSGAKAATRLRIALSMSE